MFAIPPPPKMLAHRQVACIANCNVCGRETSNDCWVCSDCEAPPKCHCANMHYPPVVPVAPVAPSAPVAPESE